MVTDRCNRDCNKSIRMADKNERYRYQRDKDKTIEKDIGFVMN